MPSYVEVECSWYEHIDNALLTHYTEYKQWQAMIEETENMNLYTMQINAKYNFIYLYLSNTFQ